MSSNPEPTPNPEKKPGAERSALERASHGVRVLCDDGEEDLCGPVGKMSALFPIPDGGPEESHRQPMFRLSF